MHARQDGVVVRREGDVERLDAPIGGLRPLHRACTGVEFHEVEVLHTCRIVQVRSSERTSTGEKARGIHVSYPVKLEATVCTIRSAPSTREQPIPCSTFVQFCHENVSIAAGGHGVGAEGQGPAVIAVHVDVAFGVRLAVFCTFPPAVVLKFELVDPCPFRDVHGPVDDLAADANLAAPHAEVVEHAIGVCKRTTCVVEFS